MIPPIQSLCSKEFEDLVDLLFADFSGSLCMLKAYIDASRRNADQPDGILAVSATVFGPNALKKANREWLKLWPESFHMNEFHAAKKEPYKQIKLEKKTDEKMERMVGILKRRSAYGISISCSMSDVAKHAPTVDGISQHEGRVAVAGLKSAYGLCLHLLMIHLAGKTRGNGGKILYTLEEGDEGQGALADFIRDASKYPQFREKYNYAGLLTVPAEECRMLETADYLAWEWSNFIDRNAKGKPVRPSIAELFKSDVLSGASYKDWRYYGNHIGEEKLAYYFGKLKNVAMASNIDELESALTQDEIEKTISWLYEE